MPHPTFLAALAPALAQARVACEVTPQSGAGPYTARVVVRPQPDEVAEFPELRGILGAERPAWQLNFEVADYVGRPVAGDRVTTTVTGDTYQLRHVQTDRLGIRWLCAGFLVEDEVPATLAPSIYMPAGCGFATAGSLL